MYKRYTNINIDDDIVFNEYYNKRIAISDHAKKPLTFQMPRLYMPFGLSGFVPTSGPVRWNIEFEFKSDDDPFYKWVRAVEDRVKDEIFSRSEVIFGSSMSRDEIDGIFTSNIKESNPPRLRIKADTWPDKSFKFKVFDDKKLEIVEEQIMNGLYKQREGISLVELNNIYFFNGRFGVVWRCTQLQIFNANANQPSEGKCLIDFSAIADI
jgi:hypothetical protein